MGITRGCRDRTERLMWVDYRPWLRCAIDCWAASAGVGAHRWMCQAIHSLHHGAM